ncbi:hypothetical protein NtB2_01541 [Lactococcus termiticola]|uniref:Uncharacterized protein n=1 Tax=Lactococcus termiticola TaxID=2169526 RepID=A0A2R5HKZ6_9LACT|nr:hypothetical protein NtB2_01541 [Lactococcus termiticola]
MKSSKNDSFQSLNDEEKESKEISGTTENPRNLKLIIGLISVFLIIISGVHKVFCQLMKKKRPGSQNLHLNQSAMESG